MDIAPLRHTGDSANIAFYTPEKQDGGYVWCEVLRSYYGGPVKFYIRVFQYGQGRIADFDYQPARQPRRADRNKMILPDRTVTRLVREHLKDL
jgi:hypothetical protein